MMKTIFLIFFIVSLFGFQLNSCSSNDEMIEFGPNNVTNLVVFFNKYTDRKQIENFYKDVISVSRSDGRGHNLPKGVALQYQIKKGDYEGVGINFSNDATLEQREKLKKAVENSPIVYKVYVNIVPSKIKDL